MSDESIVVLGDRFFCHALNSLCPENDHGVDEQPLILTAPSAPLSLLTTLERFIRGRSLLIVHLGGWEISKFDAFCDMRIVAEWLAQSCERLKASTPELTIVVYQLSHAKEDTLGRYKPEPIERYNERVDAFNEHLRELLGESAILDSFGLDGRDDVLDKRGWNPNVKGQSLISNAIMQVIFDHRMNTLHQPHPTSMRAESALTACDTLIVGGGIFSDIQKHLSRDIGDTVVVTARDLSTTILVALSQLVGKCDLKCCIIYIRTTDAYPRFPCREDDMDEVAKRVHTAAQILKTNNPECTIIVCWIEAQLKEENFFRRGAAYQMMCDLNSRLVSDNFQIQKFALGSRERNGLNAAKKVSEIIASCK